MDPVLNTNARKVIPVACPHIPAGTADAVNSVISSGWISGGKTVDEFERAIAERNSEFPAFGVACNSGTTALHLALVATGIDRHSSVIVPTLTMVAVANAVRYCGAEPYFVDSNTLNGNMDVIQSIGPLVNGDADAIIVPHLYGSVSDVPRELRRRGYNGWIIQDCAESHYAKSDDGRKLLDHPKDVLTFSFYANKIIATGEGGMAVCADESLANRMRSLRAHAFTPGNHFHHQEMAFGYRMTDMQAAVGLMQHWVRRRLLSERASIASEYLSKLAEVPWIEFPRRSRGDVWWVFPILVRQEWLDRVTVERVREVLAERGIETRRYFKPLHSQPHLQHFSPRNFEYPVACDLYERGLYLPLYPDMTYGHVDYIVAALQSV